MPWKECHIVDERLRFLARLMEGDKMAVVCEEFWDLAQDRLQDLRALQGRRGAWADRSQPAAASPCEPAAAGGRNPDCAPEEGMSQLGCPEAAGAPEAALAQRGLSRHQSGARRPGPSRSRAAPPPNAAAAPNRLWCADYKGEFLLGNHRYCYPLTITDFSSRYLVACEAQSSTRERYAFAVFERAFQDFGLPEAIRTDNGVPFASAHALYGLSKLAVWWRRLGIGLERIAPGHPEPNGRHERLHLTLKIEATHPAAANVLQQQARFDTRPLGPTRSGVFDHSPTPFRLASSAPAGLCSCSL